MHHNHRTDPSLSGGGKHDMDGWRDDMQSSQLRGRYILLRK